MMSTLIRVHSCRFVVSLFQQIRDIRVIRGSPPNISASQYLTLIPYRK